MLGKGGPGRGLTGGYRRRLLSSSGGELGGEGERGKPHKLIVTNVAALKRKYGAGARAVLSAVSRMIDADRERSLETELVEIDTRTAAAAKAGVDALFADHVPHYVLILGADDVVPQQLLENPLHDRDPFVPSDLPYASEAQAGKRIAAFLSATRVVGRLPDVHGATDPSGLVKVIDHASGYRRRPREELSRHFGVTASAWSRSTKLTLDQVFGSSLVHEVPYHTWEWPQEALDAPFHYINCHGAPDDPAFYGQSSGKYPKAHDPAYVSERVRPGTVVVAECCYGARLDADPNGEVAMSTTYLRDGAYGYLGSSTASYGSGMSVAGADILCRFFLERVLAGASLGRALLEARQRFVQTVSMLDPVDLKTLAQFNLMGDPSIHVLDDAPAGVTRTDSYKRAFPTDGGVAASRRLRRERLTKFGRAIGGAASVAHAMPSLSPAAKLHDVLRDVGREAGVPDLDVRSFAVRAGGREKKGAHSRTSAAFHVAVGRLPETPSHLDKQIVVVATEWGGELVRLKRLHAR